ncbi:hypothetical protein Tco_1039911 [Tanacetum coccineum]
MDTKGWTTLQMMAQNKVKDDLMRQLLEWDKRAKNGLLNASDVAKREEWIMDLNHLDQIQRADLKQNYAKLLQSTILEACDKGLYKGVSLIESGRIVGVGVSCNELEAVANSLGCSHDFLPFSYLGLPVGKRMKSCGGWSDVINRFRDRLSSWKAKSLSIGVEKNARWCTVIKDFYGIDGGFRSPPNSFGMGGIWCDIIMSVSCIGDFDSTFNSSFALKISTGVNTSFWANPWVTNGIILKDP